MLTKAPRSSLPIAVLLSLSCLPRGEATVPEGFAVLADRSGVDIPTELKPATATYLSPWKPTMQDEARGFAACVVDTEDSLTPDWLWPEPTPSRRIDLFACPGQYKACAMAVRTLKPVNGLTVTCDGLSSATGGAIDAENLDIRLVQYVPRESREELVWEGLWLQKSFPVALEARFTAWVWVTIHVPVGTAPGVLTGQIVVADGAGNKATLPVRLRVLEFELQYPKGSWGLYLPGHFHGPDVGSCKNYASAEYWSPENLERYFRFWKTRGLNSPALFHAYPELKCVDGHAVADFGQIRRFAQAMKKAGLDGELCIDLRFISWWANTASDKLTQLRKAGEPIQGDLGVYKGAGQPDWEPDEGARRLYREAVRQLLEVARAEDWPPILLIAEEEVGNGGVKQVTYDYFMPVLQELAPNRTLLVDNAIGYERQDITDRGARDNLAVRQYNNWTQEGLDIARRQGKQVRSYNYGWRRSAWGIYQHSIGSTGYHQWADQWNGPNPWVYSRITDGGVVTSPRFELAREGRVDHAYLHTLDLLADRLQAEGKQKAAATRQTLEDAVADVPVNRFPFSDWQRAMPSSRLDLRIWRVVLAIRQARQALGDSVAPLTPVAAGRPTIKAVAARKLTAKPTGGKSLQILRTTSPIKIDGKTDEPCWSSGRNATGALWWTWNKESAMRAAAGSVEEFSKMYAPSYSGAQLCYDDAGLYIAIHCNHSTLENSLCKHEDDDAGIWQDDCMELFFETKPGTAEFLQLIVNVCGKRTLLDFHKVVLDSGIKTATVSPVNDSGGYSQEVFVPWQALGQDGPPVPGVTWAANVGREFHSWNQIMSWGQVNSQFAEKAHWGLMAFAGAEGQVSIEKADLGSRFPGLNRLSGRLVMGKDLSAQTLTVRLRDHVEATVASTKVSGGSKSASVPFSLDYVAPARPAPVTWSLQAVDAAGEVLGALPVPIPAAGPAIAIQTCPPEAASGASIDLELLVRLGDLSAPQHHLAGELVSPQGARLSLGRAPLAAGLQQRAWIDTSGLAPGKWELYLWAQGAPPQERAVAQIEVLPAYTALR